MSVENEEEVNRYVNRDGIASDTAFLIENFKQAEASLMKLSNMTVTLDLSKSSKSMVAAISEISEAQKDIEKSNSSLIKSQVGSQQRLGEVMGQTVLAAKQSSTAVKSANEVIGASYDTLLKRIVAAELAQEGLKASQKELVANYKAGKVSLDDYVKGLEENKEAQFVLKGVLADSNKELKVQTALNEANTGSIDQARAAIGVLTQARDNLDKATSATQIKELNDEIDKNTEFIRENSDAYTQRKINIGNYGGSAKIIVDAMEQARAKIAQVDKEFGKASPEAAQARHEFEALDRITQNPKFLNIAAKVGDTNKELSFFTQRLNELEDAGLRNSAVYTQIQNRLASLKDQLGDTRAEVKALSSDTRSFDLFAGSVSFAADAFQTFAGAAVLAGASEEDATAATKTLVAVQSVANGVKGIANELTTKGTAANIAYNAVQKVYATATDASAASTVRLAAATKLLLGGAIIGVIAYAVVKLIEFRKAASDAAAEAKGIAESMEGAKSAFQDATTQVNDLRTQIDLAKEGFVKKDAVVKTFNETIGKTVGFVSNLEEAEKSLEKNADAYIKFTLLKAAAAYAGQKASEQLFLATQAELKATKEFANGKDKFVAFGASNSSAPGYVPGQAAGDYNAQLLVQAADRKKNVIKAANDTKKVYTDVQQNLYAQLKDLQKQFPALNFNPLENSNTDKLAQDAFNRFKAKQQRLIEEQKKIVAGTTGGLRDNAREQQAALEIELIDRTAKYETSVKGQTSEKLAEIEDTRLADIKKVKRQEFVDIINFASAERTELEKQLNEEGDALAAQQAAIDKRELDAKEKHERALHDITIAETTNNFNKKLTQLDEQFARGQIKEKDYNAKKLKLQAEFQVELLKIELDAAEKQLEIEQVKALASGDQEQFDRIKAAQEKIRGLKNSIASIIAAFQIDKNEEVEDEEKQLQAKRLERLERFKDVAFAIADAVGGIYAAIGEREKNRIQADIDLLEQKKQKDIEVANQSIANAQDRAAAISIIEARAAAEKSQLELKQRQEEERTAKFQKAVNIVEIIAETALAVVHQLKSGDPYTAVARAFAVGAIGAAKLAVVIATPIPKYKHGKPAVDSYAGPAIVGDGGKSELIVRADGSMEVTDSAPALAYVHKNDVIYPDAEQTLKAMTIAQTTKAISATGRKDVHVSQLDAQLITSTLNKNFQSLERTIKNKVENHITLESPAKKWVHSAGDSIFEVLGRPQSKR